MFKTLFLTSLILLSINVRAQTSKIDIPMKKGKVYYEKTYSLNESLKQDELYKRALKWFKQGFPNTQKIKISADEKTGEITGIGIFNIITSNTGNHYFMRFAINIKVYDDGYIYTADKFYEKPIESGISNEYSKIEYRWWDYRQGKPWSAEDETLFKGIVSNETALMASLEEDMNK